MSYHYQRATYDSRTDISRNMHELKISVRVSYGLLTLHVRCPYHFKTTLRIGCDLFHCIDIVAPKIQSEAVFQAVNLHVSVYVLSQMALVPRHLRLRLLQLQLQQARARRQQDAVLVGVVGQQLEEERRQRRRRRWWVKPWLMRRQLFGQYDTLMQELMEECHSDFKSFLRMEPCMFHEILQRVGPRITKNNE